MRRTKNKKACHYTIPSKTISYKSKNTVIPVEIVELEDNSYHLIIKIEIDGIQGDMIIDTGASVTVVDRRLFPDKANDETGIKMQSGSVTGQINDVRIIKADHLKIGNRKVKELQLATIDLDYVNNMYEKHLKRKIIGLLGSDFCVRFGVIINYRNKELSMNIEQKYKTGC